MAIAQEERKPIIWPKCSEDGGVVFDDVVQADDNVEAEPYHNHWREQAAHKLGAKLLDEEQRQHDD